jgi:hypothetical protein
LRIIPHGEHYQLIEVAFFADNTKR